MAYSYSFWIYLDSWSYKYKKPNGYCTNVKNPKMIQKFH